MNTFYNINRIVGVVLGIALVGFGVWYGLGAVADARRKVAKKVQKQIERELRESADSLPPGLNGEYPKDGPMAEFYRRNKSLGDISIRFEPNPGFTNFQMPKPATSKTRGRR